MARPNYWNEKQENLCAEWLITTNSAAQSRIYKELLPALNYMIENIMQRYYSVHPSMQTSLKSDCVTEVFLRLHKYDSDKQKAYTFCSMVVKHYIYEVIVRIPQTKKNMQHEFMDTGEVEIDDRKTVYENYDIDYDVVVEYFNNLIIKYRKEMDGKSNTKNIETYILVYTKCAEYVNTYHNVNANWMAEYVYTKTDLSKNVITHILKSQLNLFVIIANDEDMVTDFRFKDILNDDLTPNDMTTKKHYHREKQKKMKTGFNFL